MINLKVNLISKRAQDFLSSSAHFLPNQTAVFRVSLDESDKILTVSHSNNEPNLEKLFAEVLAKFAKNKKISELWKINFREVESFLRDENHLPAFPENQDLAENALIKSRNSLIASAVETKLQNNFPLLNKQVSQWGSLSLVEKNKWADMLLAPLEWQLIYCEGDVLNVTKIPEGVDSAVLTEVIQMIFKSEGKLLPVKLVAV
jgi:hypothetical protein